LVKKLSDLLSEINDLPLLKFKAKSKRLKKGTITVN